MTQPTVTTNNEGQPKVSAVINLNRKTERLLKVSVILVVVGIFISLILLLLAQQQTRKIVSLRQELESLQLSTVTSQGLFQFIASQGAAIDRLLAVFPHEATIIDFLGTVEAVVQQYDPEGSLSFNALNPTKVNNELAIPLAITFNGTAAEAVTLLKELEKLPYIIKITVVDIRTPNGLNQPGEITLGGRLYVREPFR